MCTISTSVETPTHEDIIISIYKHEDHIIYFECKEKMHYKNKYNTLAKIKVQVTPKMKMKPKEMGPMTQKGMMHFV